MDPRTMPAGRELDAAVASKVFGLSVEYVAEEPFDMHEDSAAPLGFVCNFGNAVFTANREWLVDDYWIPATQLRVPPYSTSWEAAGEVLERLQALGFIATLQTPHFDGDAWGCKVDSRPFASAIVRMCATAETGPLAICRAALLALGEAGEGGSA